MKTIRIIVADDQELVRDGFSMILDAQPDLAVVAQVGNGSLAVQAAERHKPDIVLMDIRMPIMDGIEATRQICDRGIARVIVLSTYDLDAYVFAALTAGASGFLLKDLRRDDLVGAVRVVASGDALLAPSVTRQVIAHYVRRVGRPSRAPDQRPVSALTPRERETLGLIARGLNNAEIAAELVVSEHTVKSHVSSLLSKLGLRDRVQAVIYAYRNDLTTPDSL